MTKRKRLDKESPDLQEVFQMVFVNLPIGAFVVQNRKFRLFNPQFQKLLGYTTDELVAMDCLVPVLPDDRDMVRDNAVRWLKGKHSVPYEYRYVRKDGTAGWAMETVISGQYRGERAALGYFVDITERKQSEQSLRESEERFRELVNLLPEIVFEMDEKGHITFANRNAFDTFGYTQGDLAEGLDIGQMVTPAEQDRLKERIGLILKGEELGLTEYTAQRKDGSTFPLLVHSTRIIHENKVVGLRGIGIDISERKQMENALKESERRYRDLFDCASDAIIVRDLEGNIVEVNEAASMLTSYTVDELVGMNISNFLTPESFAIAMERQRRQLEGETVGQRYELELVRKDRTSRTIESVSRLITENGRPVGVQSTVRDVTEQKRLRQNMQFYITEITKAQEEERKRIARELHDETAQSLATLSLDIEAITRAKDQVSEETIQRLQQLRAKIDSIMEGVRRFSRQLRPDVLDQLGLLPALESLIEEVNEEGKINARVEVIGSGQRLAPDVELVLFRIAQEALHNARRHSRAREAVVRVEFSHRKVKLNVIDNGRGFELPEALGDFAGRGKLGLIGMHERVRLLNGSFLVKSQPGRGTTVSVEVAG